MLFRDIKVSEVIIQFMQDLLFVCTEFFASSDFQKSTEVMKDIMTNKAVAVVRMWHEDEKAEGITLVFAVNPADPEDVNQRVPLCAFRRDSDGKGLVWINPHERLLWSYRNRPMAGLSGVIDEYSGENNTGFVRIGRDGFRVTMSDGDYVNDPLCGDVERQIVFVSKDKDSGEGFVYHEVQY